MGLAPLLPSDRQIYPNPSIRQHSVVRDPKASLGRRVVVGGVDWVCPSVARVSQRRELPRWSGSRPIGMCALVASATLSRLLHRCVANAAVLC